MLALALGGVYLLAYLLYLEFYVWYIMHSCLLLCIKLLKCDHNRNINVIMIFMWYVTCVLSTLNYLYVISLVLCSFAFASAFYSDANELYLLYSCLFHIFGVHYVGLGHISLLNSFGSYWQKLIWTKHNKNLTLSHTRGGIVINHQKGGDWKHLGPLLGFGD